MSRVGSTVQTVADLADLPINCVLVDRIGCAWQVIELGQDESFRKGGKDTRRPGFVHAGHHVHYEAAQVVTCLPMRVVDDGRPEPDPEAAPPPAAVPALASLPDYSGAISRGRR